MHNLLGAKLKLIRQAPEMLLLGKERIRGEAGKRVEHPVERVASTRRWKRLDQCAQVVGGFVTQFRFEARA
jgi:hypothetical protein